MTLTLHLLRHGATEPETPWRFLGRRPRPLSAEGLRQADFWRRALAQVPFAAAFCSDLERSARTAALVLEGRPLRAAALPGLDEIGLGGWDGLTREEVEERFPGQYAARGADLAGFRPPGGESFSDLRDRAWPALLAALDGLSGHVLAVGHAGTNRALLCAALGLPLERLFRLGQDPGCRNVLARGDGGWRLQLLNQPADGPG